MTDRSTGQAQLDRIELALIALLNMEAQRPTYRPDLRTYRHDAERVVQERDRWESLRLPPRRSEPWLLGWDLDDERLWTSDPGMLLAPVHQLLGTTSALAFCMPEVADGVVLRYSCFSRLPRLPRPYRCMLPHAWVYLREFRDIRLDGSEVYQQSLHGWNPRANRYVPIGAPGEPWRETVDEATASKVLMTVHACTEEDVEARWQVRVSEVTGVWLSTNAEGIHALADLRDDPRTASGRRQPLLHWVSAHLRRPKDPTQDLIEVRKHLRGITQFRLGTVHVEIHEPRKTAESGLVRKEYAVAAPDTSREDMG